MCSSIAVDHIRGLQRTSPKIRIGVVSVNCMQKERATQTPSHLIASIWRQLLPDDPVISDEVKTLYKKHINEGTRPDFMEISGIIKEEADRYAKVYVLIDALDECSDEYAREILCQQLQALQPKVNLMVTSRHSGNIARLLDDAHILEIRANPEDVQAYIEGRISRDYRLSKHVRSDTSLAEDIQANIVQVADQM